MSNLLGAVYTSPYLVGAIAVTGFAAWGISKCSNSRFSKACKAFYDVMSGSGENSFSEKSVEFSEKSVEQMQIRAELASALLLTATKELKNRSQIEKLKGKINEQSLLREKLQKALDSANLSMNFKSLQKDPQVKSVLDEAKASSLKKTKTGGPASKSQIEKWVKQLQKEIDQKAVDDTGFTKDEWDPEQSYNQIRNQLSEKGLKTQQVDDIVSKLEFYFKS